ncbi:cyclopropane-fatty-acyl-phospholipid synthase family protein [Streptomyces sp. N35]|uniref:SAM-dependent methyltransferase n=1 Tax=Streptomyces sp. N35 TaxID=2795730 RepID=UPI0018F63D45|nr:class I SAM-dependent methyltransferase [Streptomyces sp. N35]
MTANIPQLERLQELVAAPTTRHAQSTEMVTTYYALVNDLYHAGWGDSQHFPPLREGEPLAAAQARSECTLADRAELTTGQWALDIGSGIGGPAGTIAQHSGAHVIGIDLSRLRVAKARERAQQLPAEERLAFIEGDAGRLPFPDASFDVCYTFEAICHVPDKPRVHRDVFRVLKPGGRYLGYDWLAADDLTDAEHQQFIEPICRHHGIPNLATPTQLDDALGAAGFTGGHLADTASTAEMNRTWDLLEQSEQLAEGIDDPLIDFMSTGARALYQAARAGRFTIGYWEARKPAP